MRIEGSRLSYLLKGKMNFTLSSIYQVEDSWENP